MSKTQHPITDELLDQLLANYQNPEDLIGADGILKQLTKKLVERTLDAELTHPPWVTVSISRSATRLVTPATASAARSSRMSSANYPSKCVSAP